VKIAHWVQINWFHLFSDIVQVNSRSSMDDAEKEELSVEIDKFLSVDDTDEMLD
jgi:hypothetical protein